MIDFVGINNAALARGRTFLEALIPGGKFRGLEYQVRNPTRDDKQPGSFSINYRTGVWKDFATADGGGDVISLWAYVRGIRQCDAARELADKLGISANKPNGGTSAATLKVAASFNKSIAPELYSWGDDGPPQYDNEARRYTYKVDGKPVAIKIKFKNGAFAQWYRVFNNGAPSGWQAKKPEDFKPVPYITEALPPFDPELSRDQILWPEGEKDVDSIGMLNLPAFTFGGAGDGLPGGISPYLTDRHIVVLADNDEAGRKHARCKAEIANAAGAASVRIVHFLELREKGDVSDFIANGGTVDGLTARIDAAPLFEIKAGTEPVADAADETGFIVQRASEIEAKPITWLWPNRIAIGKQTLIAGDPGLGKSQLTAFLAAVVTTGGDWPCGEGRAEKGRAIMSSAEDDAEDTIVPRLIAAGADCDQIDIVKAVTSDDGRGNKTRRMFHLQEDLAKLEGQLAKSDDVRLVIIDPITAYLGGLDTHRNSDVRGVLGLVAEMAARRRVAVVAISHWNKSTAGNVLNRVTGSGAFVAAVRGSYMVAKDPDDDSDTRRLFIPMKNNLGPPRSGLAFRVEQRLLPNTTIPASSIVWESERVTKTADEIMAANDGSGEHRSSRDEAAEWLIELIGDGELDSKEVRSQSQAAGLTWATVRRAKTWLGIKPQRRSDGGAGEGKWVWRLPPERLQGAQKSQDAQVSDMSTLGGFEHLGGRKGAQ
jgi:putative DNA primase/helicase